MSHTVKGGIKRRDFYKMSEKDVKLIGTFLRGRLMELAGFWFP